jgi:hypothetical protein
MSKHVLVWCVLFLSVLGSVPQAGAQGLNTASIIGQVKDESGAVLPSVTVSASSPALQLQQVSAITDERGEYRLVELPLGTYEVTYTLPGFQGLKRSDLRLAAGFVAKIDVTLKLGSVSENVTVVADSPIVDVTSSKTVTEFLQEDLSSLPSSRNSIVTLLNQAPGINGRLDVGGSQTAVLPSMPVFGRPGQSEPMIEGINGREATGNLGGSYYDYSTFEEAQVETVAHDAESAVSGVRLNAITKSGGNAFHGTYFGAKEGQKLQANNIDATLAKQGIIDGNPVQTRWDASGDLGGHIIKDKLWFYGAARRQRYVNGVIGLLAADGINPGYEPTMISFLTGKLSYQPAASQRFILFRQYFKKDVIGGGSQFTPWYSQWHLYQPGANSKVEWVGNFGNSIVGEAQWGNSWYNTDVEGMSNDVATFDIVTMKYTGQQFNQYQTPRKNHIWRHDFKGNLSIYKGDWLHGNHDIKIGVNYFLERRSESLFQRVPAGDYVLRFQSGVPYQLATFNTPVVPLNAVNYTGAFLRDNWAVNRRLTLNMGLRFDRYNMFLPVQSRQAGTFADAQTFPFVQFNIWNEIVPRLHFAYDITGSGKTVIRGGWGRFGDLRDAYSEPVPFNPNVGITTTWKWHDLNNDKLYQPGEVNLDPNNGTDFVSSSGAINSVVNPNERQPKTDEVSGSLERELGANMSVRVTGIYARNSNNRRLLNTLIPPSAYTIAITNPDPGPDGKLGTADDPGANFTYYEYPTSLQGLQFLRNTVVNDPKYVNTWNSFELAVVKRLSHKWQFRTSYSATKYNMQFPETGEVRSIVALNPNAEINMVNRTWEWFFKASGSYRLPWDLLLSANYQLIQGSPWSRQVLFTGGKTIPSITLNVEPFGTHHLPSTSLLDNRIEKTIRITENVKLSGRIEVFNLLNVNTVRGITARSGASFGIPTSIMPPRIAQFGAQLAF